MKIVLTIIRVLFLRSHNQIWIFNLDNILIYEKSYVNILFYRISCKTLIGAKPLYISFNKIDGFIRVYDGIINLVLFGAEQMTSFRTGLDIS